MFSTQDKTNFSVTVTFILMSASVFSLEQSKNLLFGKELNLLNNILESTIQEAYADKINVAETMISAFDRVGTSTGKKRKCWLLKYFKSLFPSGLCGKGFFYAPELKDQDILFYSVCLSVLLYVHLSKA